MTLFSIVTITRNDLCGLERTFESLRNQTYRDVQHIVVDGASSDGSPQWATKHPVFSGTIVVSEPDEGIYNAMNKGLALATGRVVAFLNSGDCLASNQALEIVAESFARDAWPWAFGLGRMVDESGTPVRWPQRPRYSWLRETFWHYGIYHPAVFMQSGFINEFGGFDESYAIVADYDLVTRAGRTARPVVIPHVLAHSLVGGVSTQNPDRAQREAHDARVKLFGWSRLPATADAMWTRFLIGKTRARSKFGRFLRSLGYYRRERFVAG